MSNKQVKLKLTLNSINEYDGGANALLNDLKNVGLILHKSSNTFSISSELVGKFNAHTESVEKLNQLKELNVFDTNESQIAKLKLDFLEVDDSIYNVPDNATISDEQIEVSFGEGGGGGGDQGEETSELFSEYKSRMYQRNLPITSAFECQYYKARYDSERTAYIPYLDDEINEDEGLYNPKVDFLGCDLFPTTSEYNDQTGEFDYIVPPQKTLYYKGIQQDQVDLKTVGYNNYFTPEFYHIGYKYKWQIINAWDFQIEIDNEYIEEKEQEGDTEAVEAYKQQKMDELRTAVEEEFSPSEYYIIVAFGYNLQAQVISKQMETLTQEELNEEDIYGDDPQYDGPDEENLFTGVKVVSVLQSENNGNLIGLLDPSVDDSLSNETSRKVFSKVLTLRQIPLSQQVVDVYDYQLNNVTLDNVNYKYMPYKRVLNNEALVSDADIYIQNGTDKNTATVSKVDSFLTGYSKSATTQGSYSNKYSYDYFYNYCLLLNNNSEISSLISVKPSNNATYQDALDNLILSRTFRDTLPRLFYCKSMNPWIYFNKDMYQPLMKNLEYKYNTIYDSNLHGYVFGSPISQTTSSNISRLYSFNVFFGGYSNANSESSSYLKLIVYGVNRMSNFTVRDIYCSTEELSDESEFAFESSEQKPYRFLFLESNEETNITNLLALHNTPLSSNDFDNIEDLTNFLRVVLNKDASIPYISPEMNEVPERIARLDYSNLVDDNDSFKTTPYFYKQTAVEYPSISVNKVGFFKNGSFITLNNVTMPDPNSSEITIPKSTNPQLSINDKIYTVYNNINNVW